MDKDELCKSLQTDRRMRKIVDELLNERDLRMDDLFNRLQQLTLDTAVLKGLITTLLEDKDNGMEE